MRLFCKQEKCYARGQIMSLSLKLSRTFISVCFLIACMQFRSLAQSNAAPLPPQRPPGLGAAGTRASRMAPTGLEANGGSIAQDVYTNSIYGFSLKTPPGWVVLARGAEGSPTFADPALMKQAQVTRTLLVMSENAPVKKSYQRKSLQILATHLLAQSTPTSAQDYLDYSQKTAKEKNLPIEYLGNPEEVTVNGQKLAKLNLNETTNGTVQHIEQYVIIRNSSLLQFFLESPDENGLKDLEPSIQSLQFKEPVQKPSPKRSTRKKKPAAPVSP
jgi:hypothetical protein